MVELRWVHLDRTTILGPRLMYRYMQPCVDASGALCPGDWTEWKMVHTEVVPSEVFYAKEPPLAAAPTPSKQSKEGET